MATDAVIRIALAIMVLFVVIPALARPQRQNATVLERFFWNFGVGIALITLAGQVFTLARLFSLLTVFIAAGLVILLSRAYARRVSPWSMLKRSSENAFLAMLNIFDGRVNVRRRVRRKLHYTIKALRARTQSASVRWQIAGWTTLTAVAAALRLYRPFASANLGYSDTYSHLYLVKLLEEGRQVDPAWGPYPRGMHFLLMTIHELTNVDETLLLNFFGAFAGILMTLAVADAVRRLSKNITAGLIAGLVFATLVGGSGQYFVLGGGFGTDDATMASQLRAVPYHDLAQSAGDFDLALTAFQRQTSTLPQELAIVLLFPAALFLRDFFKTRQGWYLAGFGGCTAAIAAVHSGVVIPLIIMCALMLIAAAVHRAIERGTPRRAILTGAAAVIVGSAWMLAFIVYPYTGGPTRSGLHTWIPAGALFYFPFLRPLAGVTSIAPEETARVFVTLTPFLILCIVAAASLIVASFIERNDERTSDLWIALVYLAFLLIHFSSMLRLPQVVETARNSQWLLMSAVILLGVGVAKLSRVIPSAAEREESRAGVATLVPDSSPSTRLGMTRAVLGGAALLFLVAWTTRVPRLTRGDIHDHLVNYSGYGTAALAVLRIEQSFEPYSWTIVSYGQEFPMVLRRGFALPAVDFLDQYDPTTRIVPIPTPQIFVIVEKTPHRFEINTWARRFSRSDVEQRLQTWVQLYQVTHKNLRVYLDDDYVRVYRIDRTPEEIAQISQRASK